jgi:methylenetetrahydrofolate reductase (NADPH)
MACSTDEEAKAAGSEWGIQQSKELVAFGAPCLHFYTMGKSDAVRKIAQAVF